MKLRSVTGAKKYTYNPKVTNISDAPNNDYIIITRRKISNSYQELII